MTIDELLGRDAPGTADPVEAALARLLERHPGAIVAGVEDLGGGHPRLVAPPAKLGLPGRATTAEAAVINQVVPADRVVVARLWGRARLRGFAVAVVRPAGDPDRPGALHFFDLRRRHGMMVLVFLPGVADPEALPGTLLSPARPPRFARATKNEAALFESAGPALAQMLGWSEDELIGKPTLQFIHPEDKEYGIEAWMEMLETPGAGRRVRLRHQHRDGRWVWLEVTNHNRLSDPAHGDILCEMVDVSEEMAAHEALRAREQLLAQLTDAVPVALFHASATGELLFANRRLQDLTGRPSCATLDEQLANVDPADREAVAQAIRSATFGSDADVEFAVRDAGAARHCRMRVRALTDEDGSFSGITGCIEDVTETIRTRRELEIKAACDPLTGCLNREAVLLSIQSFLDLDRAHPDAGPRRGTAVIFIDLDGFKAINDRLGHAAGDDLLISLSARMRAAIRAGDLIGRFGGDEFVVVCPDVTGPGEALAIARNLNARAFRDTGAAAPVSNAVLASIGVAWTDLVALPAATLVEAADAAMYESKRSGRAEPVLAPPLGA